MVIELDRSVRLKSSEHERIDKLFQWDAMLQAQGNGDGEAVHQTSEGGAFLVHIEENFSQRAVLVFACP